MLPMFLIDILVLYKPCYVGSSVLVFINLAYNDITMH